MEERTKEITKEFFIKEKEVNVMENTTNRNDVIKFFRDMPQQMQIEIINKMQRQIKKPPDSKSVEIEQVELTDIFVDQ